jgi:uncharacterized integral membrane protein (TIGR00698 family)
LPGLASAFLIGLVSRAASGAIVVRGTHPVSEVILAITAGMVVNAALPSARGALKAGVTFALKRLLRLGIVLLGLGLSLQAVVTTGGGALAVIIVTVAAALLFTRWLGRSLGVRDKLATLIAVGAGICGASAIVAAAPAIDAGEEDVSYSVAVITVFGILAIFAYPLIGAALELSDLQFGTWAGVAVHETAQVVAAGFAFSEAAGKTATVVKLTRTALLAPLVLILGLVYAGRRGGRGGSGRVNYGALFPWFIAWFMGMAVLRSIGDAALAGTGAASLWAAAKYWASYAAKLAIVTAMAAVGLSTGAGVFRSTGMKPLLIGLVASVLVGALSLGLIVGLGF